MTDPFEALFEAADSPQWRARMATPSVGVEPSLHPEIYAAVFGSPEGMRVLRDLYNQYVNVTRAVPGEGPERAFYREGMAQVVFDIVSKIEEAHAGGADGDEG